MSEGNAAQRDAWETQIGARWVERVDEVERRLVPVGRLLTERARARPGERVLDVGCGAGSTTAALAADAGGRAVGIDISETMLASARGRVPPGVTLLRADAQVHDFEPPPFDLVASRFGVMFFAEPVVAFRNLRRAMAPGGRLCVVAWAPLSENPHWRIPLAVTERHLGPREVTDPRAPGPLAFSDEGYVRGILEAAGFGDVAVERCPVLLDGLSAEREAEIALLFGPSANLAREREPDDRTRAAIVRDIGAALQPFARDGGTALPATVFLITASS